MNENIYKKYNLKPLTCLDIVKVGLFIGIITILLIVGIWTFYFAPCDIVKIGSTVADLPARCL